MKIVIAPDSFKGSLSSIEAARAIDRGIKKSCVKVQTELVPIADGGEGTVDSLVAATNGHKIIVVVTGPINKKVIAQFGVLGDKKTCVIEMASASGLCLLSHEERNPLLATTYGTGELIKQALDDGYRDFILAIGGSASNDGGIGMLQALGMKLVDEYGESLGFGGGELSRLATIDASMFDVRIASSRFLIATDVQNPLIGVNGASHVFGPQKGATSEMVTILDANLQHYANIVEKVTGVSLHNRASAGAAGGIGGAFQAFFPSETKRGIDIVLEYTGLAEKLDGANYVFTGEGRFDSQTASGKAPMGVAEMAKNKGIPVFVLCGSIGEGIETLYSYGIQSVHSIVNGPMTLQESLENAASLLESRAEQVMRTILSK